MTRCLSHPRGFEGLGPRSGCCQGRGTAYSSAPIDPMGIERENAIIPTLPIWLSPRSRYSSARNDPLAKLEELFLHQNNIGDDGMKAFAEAVRSGSMGALDLTFNMISDKG